MAESKFVYVTYIRTTPERLFGALTDPEQNKLFWTHFQRTTWKVGDPFELVAADGKVWDSGTVLAFDPPRRIQVSWTHQVREELKSEGESVCTYEIEPVNDAVTKLTVTHVIGVANAKLIQAVSGGWPSIIASLKSLLETGEALPK